MLGRLPQNLRCPSFSLYLTALSTYSAAGIIQLVIQLMKRPVYWADCGLVAVIASVLTGVAWGGRAMVDALVLGGFLSLVCCKALGRFTSTMDHRTFLSGGEE
jgi:hypothetical protein